MNRRTFLKGFGLGAASTFAPLPRRAAAGRTYRRLVIRSFRTPARLIPYLTADPGPAKRLRRLCRTARFKYELSPTAAKIQHGRGLRKSERHVNTAILRQAQIETLYQAALRRPPTPREASTALVWLAITNARPRRRLAELTVDVTRAQADGWGDTSGISGGPISDAIADALADANAIGEAITPALAAAAIAEAVGVLGEGAVAITGVGLGLISEGLTAGTITAGIATTSTGIVITLTGIGMVALGIVLLAIAVKIVLDAQNPNPASTTPQAPRTPVIDIPYIEVIDIPDENDDESESDPDEGDGPAGDDGGAGEGDGDGGDAGDGGGGGGGDGGDGGGDE